LPTTGSTQTRDTILLIVEDDPHYARSCRSARDKGFKVLVEAAARGA